MSTEYADATCICCGKPFKRPYSSSLRQVERCFTCRMFCGPGGKTKGHPAEAVAS